MSAVVQHTLQSDQGLWRLKNTLFSKESNKSLNNEEYFIFITEHVNLDKYVGWWRGIWSWCHWNENYWWLLKNNGGKNPRGYTATVKIMIVWRIRKHHLANAQEIIQLYALLYLHLKKKRAKDLKYDIRGEKSHYAIRLISGIICNVECWFFFFFSSPSCNQWAFFSCALGVIVCCPSSSDWRLLFHRI